MRLSKSTLKHIIKEELSRILLERRCDKAKMQSYISLGQKVLRAQPGARDDHWFYRRGAILLNNFKEIYACCPGRPRRLARSRKAAQRRMYSTADPTCHENVLEAWANGTDAMLRVAKGLNQPSGGFSGVQLRAALEMFYFYNSRADEAGAKKMQSLACSAAKKWGIKEDHSWYPGWACPGPSGKR